MALIDTHVHLQFDKLADRLDEVMTNAKAAGVTKMICVGTNVSDSHQAVDFAKRFDNVWASVGAHPHDGKDFYDDQKAEDKLAALYTAPKVVAVGEIGLDFYKNYSPKDEQEKLFKNQLELSLDTGLPYIFHVREAYESFWQIFDTYRNIRGVIHSFSATEKELRQALSRGLYVALNGIMTITSDEKQLAAAKLVPKDYLLLETDAPFLTPAGQRGRVCEPAFTRDTAEFLAKLRGESLEELAAYTTKNAEALFGI